MKTPAYLALALLLAGCPATPPKLAGDAPAPAPAAAKPMPAAGVQDVDPLGKSVLGVALGMTADEAVAAHGQPESRYPDFLSWNGGRLTATLDDGKVVALHLADTAPSLRGFHIGDALPAAQQAFPTGQQVVSREVPLFILPGQHAWLEVTPGIEQQIIALDISTRAPDTAPDKD